MTIPPFFDEPELVRPYFRKLRELRDDVGRRVAKPLPVLSMGMSHDFEVAIEEGATEIRLGTALFGERPARICAAMPRRLRIEVTTSRDGSVRIRGARFPAREPRCDRGEHGGALKVRLTAPPVEDRANEALCRLLAERLNVPISAVRIVAGEKSRTKRVAIRV